MPCENNCVSSFKVKTNQPDYHTYPCKCTVKQFGSLQITAHVSKKILHSVVIRLNMEGSKLFIKGR